MPESLPSVESFRRAVDQVLNTHEQRSDPAPPTVLQVSRRAELDQFVGRRVREFRHGRLMTPSMLVAAMREYGVGWTIGDLLAIENGTAALRVTDAAVLCVVLGIEHLSTLFPLLPRPEPPTD